LTSLLTIHTKNPAFGVKNGGPDYQKNIISDFMWNFALLKCQAPLRARDSLGPPFLFYYIISKMSTNMGLCRDFTK